MQDRDPTPKGQEPMDFEVVCIETKDNYREAEIGAQQALNLCKLIDAVEPEELMAKITEVVEAFGNENGREVCHMTVVV